MHMASSRSAAMACRTFQRRWLLGPGIFMMCAREVQVSEIMNRNNESMEIIDTYSLIIGMAAISG